MFNWNLNKNFMCKQYLYNAHEKNLPYEEGINLHLKPKTRLDYSTLIAGEYWKQIACPSCHGRAMKCVSMTLQTWDHFLKRTVHSDCINQYR